jgi:hypothetical protein
MDIFTLEPLPARHGDCLLLYFGPPEAPGTILIDGGPSQVWTKSLRPRLKALAAHRPGGNFKLDLMMVSHIDDDHIRGMIDFTEEWRDAETDHQPWPYKADALWFNSFERIAGGDPHAVKASVTASVGAAQPDAAPDLIEHDHEAEATWKVLASVGQGAQLRKDAEVVGLETNPGFDGHLVVPSADKSPVLFGDLALHVVGPLPQQIADLRQAFAEQLPTTLAAYTDTSVANLSSIVVLAEYGGKSILLTGDARGDFILQGLKQQGLLGADGKRRIDILKMQHHGSNRDTAPDFFKTIIADTYVASADGSYENPDRETFEMLIAARPKQDRYTIHLTYEIAPIDVARKAEHDKAVAKARAKGKALPEDWADPTHSLAAFFADCKAKGHQFEVTTPATRASACIDLLGPVTY